MEIRNALQKIENYLTVVSNLNKTILSEGTMSKDELLLMKKYLYTSIDRVEDIERLLVIDKSQEKSFTPSNTVVEAFTAPKPKEIVSVNEQFNVENLESTLLPELNVTANAENLVNDIITEDFSINAEVETPVTAEATLEVENIITEDFSINAEVETPVTAEATLEVENIITEDFSINAEVETPVTAEATLEVENIITEDFSINAEVETPVAAEATLEVENIITEDFSINAEVETPVTAEATLVVENIITEDFSINAEVETITTQFFENKAISFAEEMENRKKEENALFEQFNQQFNASPQQQLFELFDENDTSTQISNDAPAAYVPLKIDFDYSDNSTGSSVLVAEKEVETLVEELTPSFLNEIFKPQVASENNVRDLSKTFGETIALNDKFIFVRELFGNQFGEYELSLRQLDQQSSFIAAEKYCKDNLWNKFNWSEKGQVTERFMDLLQKRF